MVFNLEYQPVESSNRTTYISKMILLTFVIDNALPSLTTHCEGRRYPILVVMGHHVTNQTYPEIILR